MFITVFCAGPKFNLPHFVEKSIMAARSPKSPIRLAYKNERKVNAVVGLVVLFLFFHFKGIPSYFFLFLKKIVHDPTRNKSYYLIL